MLKENESIEDLNLKGYKIIQVNSGFKFGIDAVLLANFVCPKKNDIGVDLGSGTGVIPTIIIGKSQVAKIIGIEIQETVWDASVRSVLYNKLGDKLELLNHDIRKIQDILPKHAYDFVTANPPYYKVNTMASENSEKNISRHEFKINHKDIFSAAAYLLKPQKPFYMIHKPERLVELFEDAKKYGLSPKEIQFIHPNIDKAPNLVLLKYVKNGNAGLKFYPPLHVYDLDGNYTKQINDIYNNDNLGE